MKLKAMDMAPTSEDSNLFVRKSGGDLGAKPLLIYDHHPPGPYVAQYEDFGGLMIRDETQPKVTAPKANNLKDTHCCLYSA
jgi:hypothetical protein